MKLNKENQTSLIEKLKIYLGKDGIRFFGHLYGLTGTCSPVLKLNCERKHIPSHSVHFREGMVVRNFLRGQDECKDWDSHDYDNNWCELVEIIVK